MEASATEPRYTVLRAARLIGRPTNTVRRWSLGHRRNYQGEQRFDKPPIEADGEGDLPLSFLNLLELELLSSYRSEAALQAIRRALDFTGRQLEIARPLISAELKVHGGELFAELAKTEEWAILVNASRGESQLSLETLVAGVPRLTDNIDYDAEISRRWW